MAKNLEESRFEHKGYECIIRKTGYEVGSKEEQHLSSYGDNFQWYCGYVVLPKNHKLFGLLANNELLWSISVHGGLTYSRYEDEKWVIGFDCNHYEDNIADQHYDYIVSELKELVEQLIVKEN